jgi:N-acyl homoserine lactone hydrolase
MKHIAIALTAVALTSCASTPPAQPAVKLYALDCGSFDMKNTGMFSPNHEYDGKPGKLSDPCFLIRHPKGDLVWDAGIPKSLASPPGANLMVTNYRDKTIDEQLAQLSLTTADIEYFAISHSHYDHVGDANFFAGSTWVVDTNEREWMFRPDARKALAFANYDKLETAKTQLIESGKDLDLFGDGTVMMIPAYGHTPGHRVLLVRTANSGAYLLAGDMWHLADAQKLRTVPGGNTDKAETLRSMDKVEALAATTPATLIRQHVPEDIAALPAFPSAAE